MRRIDSLPIEIGSYSSKAGPPPRLASPADAAVPDGQVDGHAVNAAQVVVLSDKLCADGTLNWDVPAGNWTILRFGRTLTGQTTRPAPAPGLDSSLPAPAGTRQISWHDDGAVWRTQTWWDMVPAFHTYISRTGEMLREGLPVADVLYLTPEGAPQVFTPPASALTSGLPDRKDYNFDGCSPRTLIGARIGKKRPHRLS